MIVVGIDPGRTGALAAVTDTGELLWVTDMPVVDGAVSAPLLLDELAADTVDAVVVEQVSAMPRQGVTSTFNFGVTYGTILGVVTCRWPLHHVRPNTWKKAMGVTADKDTSRRRAIELWPGHAASFRRKRDDGRAEAALIARWFIERRQP